MLLDKAATVITIKITNTPRAHNARAYTGGDEQNTMRDRVGTYRTRFETQ